MAIASTAGSAGAAPIPLSYTGGFQTYTAPTTGVYDILAFGAQGGSGGGLRAEIGGSLMLTAGEVLDIAVRGQGGRFNIGSGGGGGSFVVAHTTTAALVIAGGGGG